MPKTDVFGLTRLGPATALPSSPDQAVLHPEGLRIGSGWFPRGGSAIDIF
jgi:hypothetical protein